MKRREWLESLSDAEFAAQFCGRFEECRGCPGEDLCEWEAGHANGLIKWLRQEVDEDGE